MKPREFALVLAVPAAWGILLLFHPTGDTDDFYPVIEDNVTAWLTVHVGMAIFVPLFAAVVFLLLRGVEGTAAMVSRIGMAVFAVMYAAWELLLGGGTGILANEVNALPPGEQVVGRDLVESYADSGLIAALSVIGSLGLAAGLIAAVIALRGAYRMGWAPIALVLVALPLIAIHEPPFGPAGLALFIVAMLLFARQLAAAPVPRAVPVTEPASAAPA